MCGSMSNRLCRTANCASSSPISCRNSIFNLKHLRNVSFSRLHSTDANFEFILVGYQVSCSAFVLNKWGWRSRVLLARQHLRRARTCTTNIFVAVFFSGTQLYLTATLEAYSVASTFSSKVTNGEPYLDNQHSINPSSKLTME
jgi:hypothetical protein